jgi:hypothetical protein
VPYQLHCCAQLELLTEELTDDGVEDLTDEATEDGAEEEVVPPQAEPLRVGRSAAPPFLFTWKPKLADWPG